MDCRALTFRQLPHQPKLFLELLEHFSKVAKFYAHEPTMASVRDIAQRIEYPADRRAEVGRILREQNERFGAGEATLENLARLERGAIAIVSGQQVGLFSGPAYAIYKALTAIQIAQELTREGVQAVPVFWMATEDHDLEEVRHTSFFANGKLRRFELPDGNAEGRPVGRIALGPQVEAQAHEAGEILARQGNELLGQMLVESYRAEETYGSAFAKLFTKLFAEQGLILLDPLDTGLHKVAAPIYQHALDERDALNEKLLLRGKELEKAGFAAQVKVTSRSTLMFYLGDGMRQVITATADKFQAGKKSWSRGELVHMTHTEPQDFSPNALFRSVVQDYLLPTAAYVGGPAEISYFAQSEVVYRHLLGRMPVMLPRAGFTVLDVKADKILRKYGLTVDDVWAGPQEVRRRMETASVPKNLLAGFDRNRKQTERMLAELQKSLKKLDPTLVGAAETARKKIGFQLEKLRRKAGKAQDSKDGLISGHEQFLESLIYPHKQLQSRELNFLPFLAKLGLGGLSELQEICSGKSLGHHFIVQLP
jgi:bacillithiol biosynthesis cysteine-adding enzyme BshC